jgi:hypothetical protein
MSHKDTQKQQQDLAYNQMQAANTKAAEISPFQQSVNDYNQKLFDMYTGKTSFDLSKMPNANAIMPLYDAAKARTDEGRIGKGLAYGGASGGAGGYNPNLIAEIDMQNQDQRGRDAAGQVEQMVSDTFGGIGAKMLQSGAEDQSRRNNAAGFNMDAWKTLINRPKQTPWWQTALAGGLGVAGAFAGRPSGGP